jgi:hypothetical protein
LSAAIGCFVVVDALTYLLHNPSWEGDAVEEAGVAEINGW